MPRAYPCCNGRFKRLSSTWTARSSTTKARAKQKGICKGTVLTGASHEALEAPLLRRDKALSWDRRTVCAWSCRYVESCRNFGVGCGLREQDLHGKIVGTKTEDWSRKILQAPAKHKPKPKLKQRISISALRMSPWIRGLCLRRFTCRRRLSTLGALVSSSFLTRGIKRSTWKRSRRGPALELSTEHVVGPPVAESPAGLVFEDPGLAGDAAPAPSAEESRLPHGNSNFEPKARARGPKQHLLPSRRKPLQGYPSTRR